MPFKGQIWNPIHTDFELRSFTKRIRRS